MKRIYFYFFLFIMVSAISWQFIATLVVEPVVQRQLATELDQYYRQLIKGSYHIVLEDLQRLAPDRWSGHVESLQAHFGYPIRLDRVGDLALPADELAQLLNGDIVVLEDGEVFYQRVGQSDRVVTMGAIPDFEPTLRIEVIIWTMLVIVVGLMALIWAMPFSIKLRRISRAAEAFGRGEFDARAMVPKCSVLAPLARSFNDMARRIQQLIGSHKELTQAVSHELRTPISRIRFGMEILATADDAAERRDCMEEIHRDVDELDTLVSELLLYAQFDRETPVIELRGQPIGPWLAAVAEAAEKDFTDVCFEHLLPAEDSEIQACFEPRFMARAVTNLVRNAAKYAAGRVRVSFEKAAGDCLIHVDDDGPGVAAADRERIFEPFVRLDISRSRDTGGCGLGLAIVQKVASWHGGRVSLTTSLLGGARFTLSWPDCPECRS